MIAAAPGKLFTTGAYAILEGAPAIVIAVDRYVIAETTGDASTRPEVLAVARALGKQPPAVDVAAFEQSGRKLGLGGSAAAAVAAAAALLGGDLESAPTRRLVLDTALRAHAAVQPRGSGADVAAATFGGVVRVQRASGELLIESVALPRGLMIAAFALDRAARTSDVLDRLDERRGAASAARRRLVEAATDGAAAIASGDRDAFIRAGGAHVDGLDALGAALDLPLVPPEVRRARELLWSPAMLRTLPSAPPNPVLLPSGAGGGDTVLWLGARAPTEQEVATLDGLGLHRLDLGIDHRGVHRPRTAALVTPRDQRN